MTTPPAPWRQGWPVLVASAVARFVLACLLLLVAASVLPALWGWQATVVASGSMEPTLHPGDVVVVRPVPAAELTAGRIALVDDPDLPGSLRVHRIVGVEGGRLRLRGDANPGPDTSLVAPAAVHGVGTLRFPALGLPALWLQQHRLLPVTGTAAALAALVALALLHRSAGADGAARRRLPAGAPRALALAGVGVLVVALPGSATPSRAVFSATATNPGNTLAAAAAWSCGAAVAAAGATEYYPLQETAGTTAVDAGTWGSSANATYSSSGVGYGARGPRCAVGQQSAITLDGTNGAVWTPTAVTNPQTFSVQVWFATTTTTGGKLIGFGDGTGGAQSANYDRHVYMTNSGQLAFGVYDGATHVVTSPASYDDGAWHLAVATFSSSTGMRLYVDGALVGRDTTATVAQNFTGYWRIGYDNLNTWPSQPTSYHFAGSLAHAAVYGSVLSATQVTGLWTAAPWSCASAAGPSGAAADLYWPLQEAGGTVATDAGTAGAAGNGTYASSGVSYERTGPNCGTGADGAVRFDGSTGQVWTTQAMAGPQSFTVQTWFATSTPGGMLIGFGNGTGGALSSSYDRHIYLSASGQVSFGVFNGGYYAVTTTGGYADGNWHLATGTFSPSTGVALYVDGALVGTNTATTAAEAFTGSWRLGADSVGGWPNASGAWFTGRLAHASVTDRVLTADEVAGQYLAGK